LWRRLGQVAESTCAEHRSSSASCSAPCPTSRPRPTTLPTRLLLTTPDIPAPMARPTTPTTHILASIQLTNLTDLPPGPAGANRPRTCLPPDAGAAWAGK